MANKVKFVFDCLAAAGWESGKKECRAALTGYQKRVKEADPEATCVVDVELDTTAAATGCLTILTIEERLYLLYKAICEGDPEKLKDL